MSESGELKSSLINQHTQAAALVHSLRGVSNGLQTFRGEIIAGLHIFYESKHC